MASAGDTNTEVTRLPVIEVRVLGIEVSPQELDEKELRYEIAAAAEQWVKPTVVATPERKENSIEFVFVIGWPRGLTLLQQINRRLNKRWGANRHGETKFLAGAEDTTEKDMEGLSLPSSEESEDILEDNKDSLKDGKDILEESSEGGKDILEESLAALRICLRTLDPSSEEARKIKDILKDALVSSRTDEGFLHDRLKTVPGASLKAKDAWNAYQDWGGKSGRRAFYRFLDQHFTRSVDGKGNFWKGAHLRDA